MTDFKLMMSNQTKFHDKSGDKSTRVVKDVQLNQP
jgi:hypothetical protein